MDWEVVRVLSEALAEFWIDETAMGVSASPRHVGADGSHRGTTMKNDDSSKRGQSRLSKAVLGVASAALLAVSTAQAHAATVTTDLLSLISLLIVTRHNLWTQLLETIPKPVLSAALMGIVLWWLREIPFLVNVVLSVSLYAAGLLVSGAMSLQEISQLKHVFAKKP